jgi:serine phosphatase RsbU (regulator of sigma subunit)/anti-sigma regulatory factor (Ser/Thr protein kinase)/tetratricopeptide (TPR) repeat protein
LLRRVDREQLKVPANIDYLGDLRDFVTQVGKRHGFTDKVVNAFKLAIDEAATNIIRHAYRDGDGEGFITIRAIVKKSSLTIALIDQGTYFDPKRVKDPDLKRYIDIGKKGGLGIFIMRKVMDSIDYRRTEEGNELRITKYRDVPQKKKLVSAVASIPFSLKAKYFLRTIAVISLIIGVSYFYFYIHVDDNVLSEFIIRGRSACNQIVTRISAVSLENFVVLEDFVNPIFDEYKGQIYQMSIVDSTGLIVYSTNIGEYLTEFTRPNDFKEIAERVYKYTLNNNANVYEFETTIVLKSTGRVYGTAHILFPADETDSTIRAIRLENLKLALFILGMSYIGVAVLIYLVLNPFRKLSDWVKSLGQGEIDDEIDIDTTSELGEIAQAFSDITHKFRESQKNLADQERLQKEMQVAQEIQQTLLPMEFPDLEGYELASFYEAAKEVGGDYYDFVEVDKDTLGIAVADVSGKGVPGSLVMTMIRTALRTEARGVKDAAEVLAKVNAFVSGDIKKGMFVTVFYLIIDSKKRRINYASAGHNPMILYRGSTKKTYYLNPKGFPIGIQLPQKDLFRQYIESDTIQLTEDDILLVYTDGITEAMNPKRELFGEERLLKIFREYGHLPVEPFVEKLKEGIYSFTEGNPQFDDITLVAIKEESSPQKDELRRAKQAHQLISEGKSIREACETVGITTYAYYNKYKRVFEEDGIEAFEIDHDMSVEAKHLSIEEKTKIIDIICNHPEYGSTRISAELNTEKYGFTVISESKIYDELVRSRLNTRQLRQAFVEKGKRGQRRLKPPGTPMLTLDGKLLIDRQVQMPETEETIPTAFVESKEMEPTMDNQEIDSGEIIESIELSDEPLETEEEVDETLASAELDSELQLEADSLINASIEEVLSKDNYEENIEPETDSEIFEEDQETQTKDEEESGDLFEELVSETNLTGAEYDVEEEQNSSLQNEEELPKTNQEQEDEVSFEELFEGGTILQEEEILNPEAMPADDHFTEDLLAESSEGDDPAKSVDDLNSQDEEQVQDQAETIRLGDSNDAPTSGIQTVSDEDLTFSSVEELLIDDNSEDFSVSSDISYKDETSSPAGENEDENVDEKEKDVSFSDLIKSIDDEVVSFSKTLEEIDSDQPPKANVLSPLEESPNAAEVENKQNQVSDKETVKESTSLDKTDTKVDKSEHVSQRKETILISGIKYYKSKDYESAIEEFKKVIEIYPDFKEAHSILGNAYFRNKMYSEAAMAYERVKQMDPEDITAYENMGVIYAHRGDYKQAVEEWKKVLEINPERTDIVKKIRKALQMT